MRNAAAAVRDKIQPFLRHLGKSQFRQRRVGNIVKLGNLALTRKANSPSNRLRLHNLTIEAKTKVLVVHGLTDFWLLHRNLTTMINYHVSYYIRLQVLAERVAGNLERGGRLADVLTVLRVHAANMLADEETKKGQSLLTQQTCCY